MPAQSLKPNLSTPVIVVGNSSANSLGVVRAFGRVGIPVYVLSTEQKTAPLNRSRYITHQMKIDSWTPENLKAGLLKLHKNMQRSRYVVFPTTDAALLAYTRVRPVDKSLFCDFVPPQRIIEFCINKDLFYEFCRRSDIAHPHSLLLNGVIPKKSDLGKLASFPVALKPSQSHLFSNTYNRKLFVVDNYENLAVQYQDVARHGFDGMLQELIPGSEFYMTVFFRGNGGKQWAAAGFQKVRQAPLSYGTGSIVEQVARPELIRKSRELLDKIGYEGIGEVEFKIDPLSGEAKVLEINARSITFNRLCAEAGIDVEHLYYQASLGVLETEFELEDYNTGLRWADLFKDFSSSFGSWRKGDLSMREWWSGYKWIKLEAYYAYDDKRPFIAEGRDFIVSGYRKVFASFD